MILDICDVPEVMKVMMIIRLVINIIRIAVPIILIISVMIDYVKTITDDTEIANTNNLFVKKIIAAVIIFLIPTFVNIITDVLDPNNNTYLSCIKSATSTRAKELYLNNMEKLMEEARKNRDLESYTAARNYLRNIDDEVKRSEYLKELEEILKEIQSNENKQSNKSKTYNLTNEELQYLANVGYCEQGDIDGIKAEVSLAANLYELQNKYSSIVEYVKGSGWFACSKTDKVASAEAVNAVKDALVNGNRTLPPYVNEHDCADCSKNTCSNGNRGDICKLEVNGTTYEKMTDIKDRSKYIKDTTIIYNRYGSVYTFHSFPCNRCDPFGYTAAAYNKYNN